MENLGEIIKPIIKVRVKTWDEMVEQYGWFCEDTIDLTPFGWHKELEKLIPEDRIIEVIEKYKSNEYYMVNYLYRISQDAIAEIIEPTFDVKSQADGLVQLMSKVDEALVESINKFGGVNGTVFENTTQQIPEPTQEQIQNYNNTILKQLAKPNGRTHYYKFTLDFCEDYSIRFFLEFSDRKDYEGNWYLKSHKLKEYSLLSKDMAEDLIRKSCTTFVEEIVGRRSGKKYEKIVVSKDKLVKFVE